MMQLVTGCLPLFAGQHESGLPGGILRVHVALQLAFCAFVEFAACLRLEVMPCGFQHCLDHFRIAMSCNGHMNGLSLTMRSWVLPSLIRKSDLQTASGVV